MDNAIQRNRRRTVHLWQTTCSKLPRPEDPFYVVPNDGTDILSMLNDDDVLYHFLTSVQEMSEQGDDSPPLVVGKSIVLWGNDLDTTSCDVDENFWIALGSHRKAIGVCIIGLDVEDVEEGHATMLFVHKHDGEMFGFVIDPNSHEWGGDREQRLRNVLKKDLIGDGKLTTLRYLEVPVVNFGVTSAMITRLDDMGFATTEEG